MIKALFLDMDDTLCDTQGANHTAQQHLARFVEDLCNIPQGSGFAAGYVLGIYRNWTSEQELRYMPVIEQESEQAFRLLLIKDLLAIEGCNSVTQVQAEEIQSAFDRFRMEAFGFYPGIEAFLNQAREYFTLVVITNGPEFSQIPKIHAVNMPDYVDHIIIGGQEPEQKPAKSIFDKALKLAGCEPHEAIHVGDSLKADIVGAHNSGITSVWIQHQQPLDAELGINPSHTVVHPSEIPEKIMELSQS